MTILNYDIMDSCIVDCSVDFDVEKRSKKIEEEKKEIEISKYPFPMEQLEKVNM